MQAREETPTTGGGTPPRGPIAAADRDRPKPEGPERMCALTRARRAPEDLIRFVLAPEGRVVPDIRAKLPGRGVWVTARARLIEDAVRRQAFSRGLKANAKAEVALAAEVDALLERDCLQSLSLANKAGLVVAGFAKVEGEIGGGKIAALLHANDAGADGLRKMGQVLRRRFGEAPRPQINLFASSQMDLALGRTNVIHAALKAGPASEAFLARCRRLAAYRSTSLPDDVQAETVQAGTMSPDVSSGAQDGERLRPGTQDQ